MEFAPRFQTRDRAQEFFGVETNSQGEESGTECRSPRQPAASCIIPGNGADIYLQPKPVPGGSSKGQQMTMTMQLSGSRPCLPLP